MFSTSGSILLGGSIVLFFLFQIVANLLFKWGSTGDGWWYGFLGGNLTGAVSIVFYMYIFSRLPGNLAAAIGSGGSFLLIQLAITVCFKTHLALPQWCGIGLICIGITLMAWQHPEPVTEAVIAGADMTSAGVTK